MLLLKNKKATHNYEILDTFTAGLSLFGFEVKSLKNKRGSFEGSYISLQTNKKNSLKTPQAILKKLYIPPYQIKNTPDSYDPYRERMLLLNKTELKKIQKKLKSARLTLIPLSIHIKNKFLKIDFAIAKGMNKSDKRQAIKKKDQTRDIQREVKAKIKI